MLSNLQLFLPPVSAHLSACHCFPGDACWPSTQRWSDFNSTVGGQLIATTPLASVCHGTTYRQDECDRLQAGWFFPDTHLPSSSSVMSPLFANNSCNPFMPPHTSCTLGNYVSYAVKIRDASDASKTLAFAAKHNVRLVIRNTGHDYNGKSTGAGALSIWTQNLNTLQVINAYRRAWYTGRAVKMGAGVTAYNAYKFADANNGIIVGGNCPTVGVAGGLTQGGGHSPLATKFGLASDQVLEWEVLTASGHVITATPSNHPTLYWALCGGGPGTYGVVLSMTVKLHQSLRFSSAKLSFAMPTSKRGGEDFWEAVKTFMESLPEMVDGGLQVIWSLVPGAFVVTPATGAGVSKKALDKLFKPTLKQLNEDGIPYQYDSREFPSFLTSYEAMNLPGSNVSDAILGGRLLPRSVVERDINKFMAALRAINKEYYVIAGISLDVSQTPEWKVAAHPYWRKTLINTVIGTMYNYTDYQANFDNQKHMTDVLIPKLDKLACGESAAYLNEASFMEKNWKSVFYGKNYGRLSSIKRWYDPTGMFYSLGGVESDLWEQKPDGRLCRT
ncbi:FAD-binding domain-containing protein [Decorospora gaudefroyi]|uniref:FAD-binding domain-containing protein n=1 Tax=Decorospora gaudefroyi TaxID=184978 RepID=A0A6A5K9V4_9PLEO|nr:FAD-binding domain-containing protein [Decorospora gaudefroyi]